MPFSREDDIAHDDEQPIDYDAKKKGRFRTLAGEVIVMVHPRNGLPKELRKFAIEPPAVKMVTPFNLTSAGLLADACEIHLKTGQTLWVNESVSSVKERLGL